MNRRAFNLALGSAALSAAAQAQTSGRVYRLATLHPAMLLNEAHPLGKIMLNGLARGGFALGENLALEARNAGGDLEKVPKLLQELVAGKPDAIVAVGYPVLKAAESLGVAIVAAFGTGDPVACGLIKSFSHPGGNITGISDDAATLTAKRLDLLKAMVPGLRRVAMLWNKDDLGMTLRYEVGAKVAQSLDISIQPLGVRAPDDFNDAFAQMDRDPPDGIILVADSLTTLNRKRVFEYAAVRRLPAVYEVDFLVLEGGLMSYGADLTESFERTAALVSRIFKGAKPADLPFEFPTRYKLAINQKTANALGLAIPLLLLAQADEVIE